MRCEVIAIGTELLLGQIIDSNSAWIGGELALAGIDSHFQTKVGDNRARMVSCIRLALDRADAVITCGGLGPTQDDITREAIAEVMGVPLIRDHDIGRKIRAMFESRGRTMTENNLRQADVPQGASVIPEMPGTAPGLICPVDDKVVYAVPGVPHEMRTMVASTILPDLQRRAGITAVIKSRVLRTWGHTESGLAEMLAGRVRELDELGNPTLAFQASGIEGLKVRITAKAPDHDEADAILDDEEVRVRAILGDVVFGVDDQTMEAVVLGMLRERRLSLAVAEQLSGGLLGSRMTAIPGAERVLKGALVTATDGGLGELVRLPATKPAKPEDHAAAIADAVRGSFGADVGLATMGLAASHSQEAYPRGTVFLGLAIGDQVEGQQVRLPGDRSRVSQYAVISLLNYLRRRLLAPSPKAA